MAGLYGYTAYGLSLRVKFRACSAGSKSNALSAKAACRRFEKDARIAPQFKIESSFFMILLIAILWSRARWSRYLLVLLDLRDLLAQHRQELLRRPHRSVHHHHWYH